MKHEWVMGFSELVFEHAEENGEEMDTDLAYQLGCAYFDWAEDGEPEETVDEAFARYVRNDELIKR